MKRHRDGIPKKQPNKVGANDTTVPLRIPIPISMFFQPGLMLVTWNDRMLDRDVCILWQFFESALV